MKNPGYDFWWAVLDGEKPEVHDGVPHCGFFRKRRADKTWEPVAIWFDEKLNKVVARIGTTAASPDAAMQVWTYCCYNAITQDQYEKVIAGGEWLDALPEAARRPKPRHEEGGPRFVITPPPRTPRHNGIPIANDGQPRRGSAIPVAEIGHNASPGDDGAEAFEDQIAAAQAAGIALQDEIKANNGELTKDFADRAANLVDRMREIEQETDAKRLALRKPFLDSAAEIQKKWTPLVDKIAAAAMPLKAIKNTWLKAEQARLDAAAEAERNRLAAEAEERRQEALRLAEQTAPDAPPPPEPETAPAPIVVAQRAQVGGGYSGRKSSQRKVYSGVITDIDAFFQTVKTDPLVIEALQSIANRTARAKVTLPGMTIKEDFA